MTIKQSGELELKSFDISNHFDEDMILIEQNNTKKPVTAIYFDGIKKAHYVKRFLVENTMSKFSFITEHEDSLLEQVSTDWRPQVELIFQKEKGKERQTEIINLEDFITVKGEKALGNKLTSKKIKEINLLDPLPYTEIIDIEEEELVTDVIDIEEEVTDVIAIEEEEVVAEVIEQEIVLEVNEEIIEEVKTEIELNITNESVEQIKPKDDSETEGQTTLEL